MTSRSEPARSLYTGTAPAALRIEFRANSDVRFIVDGASVDLDWEAVEDVIHTLQTRPVS